MLNRTLFTDNMVFQHNHPIRLVGNYQPLEKVAVSIFNMANDFFKKTYTVSIKGELDVLIPMFDNENNPFEIKVISENSVEILSNCQLGHVFLAMGQSNMRLPLRLINQKEDVLSSIKTNTNISFLSIDDAYIIDGVVKRPLEKDKEFKIIRQRFMISDIKSVLDFSGIMVVFALEHYKKHKRPIEVIDVSVPGCSLQGFLSMDSVANNLPIYQFLKNAGVLPIEDNQYTIPAGIFNEKVFPLRHLKFEGIFWLQGEHHVGGVESANFYQAGLKELITSYRNLLNQQNLRWINIHIQNHFYAQDEQGISISLINEAMNKVSSELEEVYTIPVHDQYPNWQNDYVEIDANPIHPTNKRYIGERLFYAYNCPNDIIEVKQVVFNEDHVLVILNQESKNNKEHVFGFTIGKTGESLTYADAKFIHPDTIKVFAIEVFNPNILTYGFFLYNMRCQIYGKNDIPLKPFRIGKYNDKNKYYQPYGFENLSVNKIHHLLLSTMFNQVNDEILIKPGRFIHNESIKVEIKDGQMVVSGSDKFSLSINLTQNNHPSMFEYYQYLEVTIENSNISIDGIIVLTTDQQYHQIFLKDVINHTYRFDMHHISKVELDERGLNKNILSRIKELEIIGHFNNQFPAIINHIRMYQSEVENV